MSLTPVAPPGVKYDPKDVVLGVMSKDGKRCEAVKWTDRRLRDSVGDFQAIFEFFCDGNAYTLRAPKASEVRVLIGATSKIERDDRQAKALGDWMFIRANIVFIAAARSPKYDLTTL